MWNKDEVKGKGKEITGGVKEQIGRATNDPDLENKGSAEATEGKVQKNVGKARRKVGEAIEDVGKKISR